LKFIYVYMLRSTSFPEKFYTGMAADLQARLKAHNQGECKHTAKFKPWAIKTAVAFTDEKKTIDFERYLKTSSGKTFAKNRL